MSKTVKVKTNRNSRLGQTIGIPNHGDVEVPVNGVIEVSEDTANLLVEKGRGWEYTDEKVKKPVKEKVKAEEPVEAEEIVVEANDSNGGETQTIEETAIEEDDNVVEVDLEKMGMKELKDLCINQELPNEEWEKIKSKKGLREYLDSKLS